MARRIGHLLGLLAIICGLPCTALCSGQLEFPLPVVPERCFEPSHPRKTVITGRKAIIKRVDFDGPIRVSQADVAQTVRSANRHEWSTDDPEGVVKEFAENELRDLWLDRGFFNVHLTTEVRSLGRNSSTERFLVVARVEEGPQYRLGGIRFGGDETDVPEAKLRAAFPIDDGELFDVSRIREGINSLTELFGSLGYIDFTAVPDTEVNDDSGQISVVLHLDLQKQFHIGKVAIFTVSPKVEARLRELFRPGEVFHPFRMGWFMKEYRSALPPGVSARDVHILRNFKTGTVDLGFDFRVCG